MQSSPSIFITGAGKGLGFFLAEVFHAAGHRVFAGYREACPELEALAASSERVHAVPLDVTQANSVTAAATAVASRCEGLDVLVNNAAILPEAGRGTIETTNVEVGLQVFDVNSLGPLRVTQAFLPLLRRGQRRLIVNVSSEAGSIADCWRKDDLLYCMSKSALNVQTAILKNALAPEGFQLLAVHPGWMRTSMGGPEADLDPRDAAGALFELFTRGAPTNPDATFYLDYRGEPLRF
jgi:NAD(P)-dependent dehydrogenase (short-subunit alcohol dehydrogenase family)